jgi:ribosomal-protein-serine acetyltransferase
MPARPVEHLPLGSIALRRFVDADLEAVREAVVGSLEHLRPWMPWVPAYERHDAGRRGASDFLAATRRGWEDRTQFDYAIVDDTGQLLGSIGLMTRAGPGVLEIGYWLGAAHTGKGFATRAAAGATGAALEVAGVRHVEIRHDAANLRSGAVPARLGYRRLGDPFGPPAVRATPDAADVIWRLAAEDYPNSPARRLLLETADASGPRPLTIPPARR